MNDIRVQMFVSLMILFVFINSTNAIINYSTITFLNQTTGSSPPLKKSNSIELVKKLIANRQNLTKYHAKLFLINSTQTTVLTPSRTSLIPLKPLVNAAKTSNLKSNSTKKVDFIFYLPLKPAIEKNKSPNHTTILVITFVCCFSALVLVSFVCMTFLRQPIHSAYLKLPCIHALSTAKQSRDSTPLSYSPIHRKFSVPEEFSADDLYDIYMQKHALEDLAFTTEFQSIPNFEELPCTSATRDIVASKNRFLNILPIDNTRVVLNLVNDDPATDYINGNYISGYKCANKFIATQGPKSETCEDFWRMIWELKLRSIVMLTNVTEGVSRMNKCHQYWPELNQTVTYGCYQIKCVDKRSSCDYEKRVFHLTKITCGKDILLSSSLTVDDTSSYDSINNEQQEIRSIVQYHYTKWQDMDVPMDSHTLLHVIREVNEETTREQYPIVVHCTAGVGRTGTYIAIDAMIDKIKEEGKVDIYNFVSQMRRERHLMVQTVKQYVFIYRALLEYHLFGNTRIEVNAFQSTCRNLKNKKQTLLRAEYNRLQLLPAENVSHRDAHLSTNINKNRHTQIVPYDHNRVRLSRIHGHPYINASFIEGYSTETSFIVTQDPLTDTIDEFWRMFLEYETGCIVQLHTIIESSPSCPVYYPNDVDNPMKIGSTILLNLIKKEFIEDKYIIRQFTLIDTRESLSKTIYHYEYLLPICNNDEYDNEQCSPTVFIQNLFDFINYLDKQLTKTNENDYITVHCGNGGPTCSIFCMSWILFDQLKTENHVDIFQRVRSLQRQRPAMINSFTQYEYLYEIVHKYLEDSSTLIHFQSSQSLNNSIYDNNQENV